MSMQSKKTVYVPVSGSGKQVYHTDRECTHLSRSVVREISLETSSMRIRPSVFGASGDTAAVASAPEKIGGCRSARSAGRRSRTTSRHTSGTTATGRREKRFQITLQLSDHERTNSMGRVGGPGDRTADF